MAQNIINLDKFTNEFNVKVAGKTYKVRQISVREMMGREDLPPEASGMDQIKRLIKTILEHSNIPEDILYDVSLDTITYLSGIIAGNIKNDNDVESMEKMRGELQAPSSK